MILYWDAKPTECDTSALWFFILQVVITMYGNHWHVWPAAIMRYGYSKTNSDSCLLYCLHELSVVRSSMMIFRSSMSHLQNIIHYYCLMQIVTCNLNSVMLFVTIQTWVTEKRQLFHRSKVLKPLQLPANTAAIRHATNSILQTKPANVQHPIQIRNRLPRVAYVRCNGFRICYVNTDYHTHVWILTNNITEFKLQVTICIRQ